MSEIRADLSNLNPHWPTNRLPRGRVSHKYAAHFSLHMGKQYNKVEKKRRRQAYLERKKAKAKASGKAKAKRPAKKKAEAAA